MSTIASVKIELNEDRVHLTAPYNSEFEDMVEGRGIQLTKQSWHFDPADEADIRELALEYFGTDGVTGVLAFQYTRSHADAFDVIKDVIRKAIDSVASPEAWAESKRAAALVSYTPDDYRYCENENHYYFRLFSDTSERVADELARMGVAIAFKDESGDLSCQQDGVLLSIAGCDEDDDWYFDDPEKLPDSLAKDILKYCLDEDLWELLQEDDE
ncbi:hypothetical protein [Paeniglutamicibacter sp.]|uniref:hypothetical protein n=1 Tax=Paeniglutamicibacter sp. TaxID=1934391 RepID=UPI003989CF25